MKGKDYLDTLVDKLEKLDLAEESYVNQLGQRLNPILGDRSEAGEMPEAGETPEAGRTPEAGKTLEGGRKPEAGKASAAAVSTEKPQAFRRLYRDPFFWQALGLTTLIMTVILLGGFYMDDVILSYASKAYVWETGLSVKDYIRTNMDVWLQQGRLFPLSNIYVSLLLYLVPNAFCYKLCILLFIVLDVYVLGCFLWKMTGNRWFTLLNMAIVPVCFQIRAYHDGLVAYHLLMQVVLLILLLTAMSLLKFMETKKPGWMAVSLLLYLAGLLTYELAFINIFILCFLVFCDRKERLRDVFCWKNVWRTCKYILPYFAVTLGVLGATLYIKNKYGGSYEGIQSNMDIGRVITTTVKQGIAALPLSYHVLANDSLGNMLHNHPLDILKAIKWMDLVILAGFFGLLFGIMKSREKIYRKLSLWGIGLTLWGIPSLLIGISSKYQRELYPGIGHIPVYVEYFGATLTGTLLFSWLCDKIKKQRLRTGVQAFCYLLLGFALLLQLQDNRAITEHLNKTYKYSRDILDNSIEAGVLEPLEEGDILLIENPVVYLDYPGKEYFSYKSGKHIQVFRPEEYRKELEKETGGAINSTPVYILEYDTSKDEQFLLLTKAEHIEIDDEGTMKCYVDQAWIYDESGTLDSLCYVEMGPEKEQTVQRKALTELQRKQDKISSYTFSGPTLFEAIRLQRDGEEAIASDFKGSFYGLENGDGEAGGFRWCGEKGQIILSNFGESARTVQLRFSLGSSSEAPVTVTIPQMGEQAEEKITLNSGERASVTRRLTLQPGLTELLITGEGMPLEVPGDSRCMLFRLEDYQLEILEQ